MIIAITLEDMISLVILGAILFVAIPFLLYEMYKSFKKVMGLENEIS